ncbi:membrane protein [Clostridia bacterium]|nr:membrane protein [Clostridia bacterium]
MSNVLHIAKIPIFIIPVFSFVLAQLLKVLINFIMYKRFKAERIWGAGGMPSSHSAGVCSLVVIVGRMQGISSVMFAVAVVFAMITMYDAAGVRRWAGRSAKVLNRLRRRGVVADTAVCDTSGISDTSGITTAGESGTDGDRTSHKTLYRVSNDIHGDVELKETLGHTPIQVFAGAALGIIIGVILPNGWLA